MGLKSIEAKSTDCGDSMKPFIVSGMDGSYTVVEITEKEFAILSKTSIGCGDISCAASRLKVSTSYFLDADMTYAVEGAAYFYELVNPKHETFLVVAEDEKQARRLVRCFYLDHFNRAPHAYKGIEYQGLHSNQLD